MRPRPLAVLLVFASTLSWPVAGQDASILPPEPSPAGEAHWASDGTRTLSEADLRAPNPATLDATATHTLSARLQPRLVADEIRVAAHYTSDGSPPTPASPSVAFSRGPSDAQGRPLYTGTLTPAMVQDPTGNPEHVVRFFLRITYLAGPPVDDYADESGAPYQYLADGAAPRIGALVINDEAFATLRPDEPATLRVPIIDDGGVQQARIIFQRLGQEIPVELENEGPEWTITRPEGFDLAPGVYDVRAEAGDGVGHAAARTFQRALRVGTQAPTPYPAGGAHFVQDSERRLDESALKAPRPSALRGEGPHRFELTATAPIDDEQVEARIHYTTDGSAPTGDSPSARLFASLANPQRWEATLGPADLRAAADETRVRAIFVVRSNYFPPTIDPNDGSTYEYVADGLPPRIQQLRINGEEASTQPADAPLTLAARAEDLGGIQAVQVQFQRAGNNRLAPVQLFETGSGWEATLAQDLPLEEGVYDAWVRARDTVGHESERRFARALVVGTHNPEPVAGNAHQVEDGQRILDEATLLDGSPHGLDALRDHRFTLLLRPSLEPEQMRVQLHYALDGQPPSTTGPSLHAVFDAPTPQGHRFTANLPSSLHASMQPEGRIRFFYAIHSDYFPPFIDDNQGRYYEYVSDAQPPTIEAVAFNGAARLVAAPDQALNISVQVLDATPLRSLSLSLVDEAGTRVRTYALPVHQPQAQLILPNGVQLARGTYAVRVQAVDDVGHEADVEPLAALQVGRGPPAAMPVGAGQFVDSGALRLSAVALQRSQPPVVPGPHPPTFALTLQPALREESVEVHVEYETLECDAQRRETLALGLSRRDADAWTFEGTPSLVGFAAGGECVIRFRYHTSSDLFGERVDPEEGWFSFVFDDRPPTVASLRLNGQDAATVTAQTPLALTVFAEDAGGLEGVMAEILEGGTIHRSASTTSRDGAWIAHWPHGVALSDGDYDVRIQAMDEAGHAAFAWANQALHVDNRAPRASDVQLNGQPFPVLRSQDPLRAEVSHVSDDAASVRLEFLAPRGAPEWTLTLSKTGPGTWRGDLPNLPLTEGSHGVRLLLVDAAGNEAIQIVPYAGVLIDVTPPKIALSRFSYPGLQTAARRDDVVDVRVSVLDSSEVQGVAMEVHGVRTAMVPTPGGVEFRASFTATDSTGPVHVHVFAHDEAGNPAHQVLVADQDNAPPTLGSYHVQYANGSSASIGERATIHLSVVDDSSMIQRVYVDARLASPHLGIVEAFRAPDSQAWRLDVVPTQAGEWALPVLLLDGAGNQGVGAATLRVRGSGPVLTDVLVDGRDHATLPRSVSLNFTARFDGAHEVRTVRLVLVDMRGHVAAEASLNPQLEDGFGARWKPDVAPGAYQARVLAVDAAGARLNQTVPRPFLVIDPDPPIITAHDVRDAGGNETGRARFGAPIRFHVATTDALAVAAAVNVTLPSGGFVQFSLSAHNSTHEASQALYETGNATARFTVTDEAGNVATANSSFQLRPRGATQPGRVDNLSHEAGEAGAGNLSWKPPRLGGPVLGYSVGVDVAPIRRLVMREPAWPLPASLASGAHTATVIALNADGNWGPPTTMAFNVSRPATIPGDSPMRARLRPAPLSALVDADPLTLSWTVDGPAMDLARPHCVQLELARGNESWIRLEDCATRSPHQVRAPQLRHGDSVMVRGSLRVSATLPGGDWVSFGAAQVDLRAPRILTVNGSALEAEANSTVTLYATLEEDHYAAGTLTLLRDGFAVATLPLVGPGPLVRATTAPLPAGNYSSRFSVTDAAGHASTAEGPSFVIHDESPGRIPGHDDASRAGPWMWLATAAIGAAFLTVLWIKRRKNRRRDAPPEAPGAVSGPAAPPPLPPAPSNPSQPPAMAPSSARVRPRRRRPLHGRMPRRPHASVGERGILHVPLED